MYNLYIFVCVYMCSFFVRIAVSYVFIIVVQFSLLLVYRYPKPSSVHSYLNFGFLVLHDVEYINKSFKDCVKVRCWKPSKSQFDPPSHISNIYECTNIVGDRSPSSLTSSTRQSSVEVVRFTIYLLHVNKRIYLLQV